jgi:spermidine dehydrogenase
MKSHDLRLGMDRSISRRDLLNGMGFLAGCSLLPGTALANAMLAAETTGHGGVSFPPARTGMRGNHPGSFDIAHKLAREGHSAWGKALEPDADIYDLIVVGAGVSGLSTAWFYQKTNPGARILILDNHDDFGGHAKRNEMQVGDRTLISYGGSQSLEAPSGYSKLVHQFLKDIGIDLKRWDSAYNNGFLKQHQLTAGLYFEQKTWGVNRVVPYDLGTFGTYLPIAASPLGVKQAVAQMPISEPAREQLTNLITTRKDHLEGMSEDQRWQYLYSHSYRDFIANRMGVTEADVFKLLQDLSLDMSVGIDAAAAGSSMDYSGLPGWGGTGLEEEAGEDPYIYHFPDGNAGVARLLVRQLIPGIAPGSTMEDIVLAPFDYSKLDRQGSPVRLRLESTVVKVEQDGGEKSAGPVQVDYVRQGKTYRVRAKATVLACYHSIIPFLCPQLPQAQRQALSRQVKAPILYTNVALRNWQAFKQLGIGAVTTPGGYHTVAMLDFPVSLGGYEYSAGPDEPVVLHMERFVHRNNEGLNVAEQRRLGQYELFSTSFETIERNVRSQLAGMLSETDFDPARDISAITCNRWAHGYSLGYSGLFDQRFEDRNDERYPHVQARQPFGRISIANCDAAAAAWLPAAVEQAHRAVVEIT